MADIKDILIKRYDGTSWIELLPVTVSGNVDDSAKDAPKFVTKQQKEWLDKAQPYISLTVQNNELTGILASYAQLDISSLNTQNVNITDGTSLLHIGLEPGTGSFFEINTSGKDLHIGGSASTIIKDPRSQDDWAPTNTYDLVTKGYLDTVGLGVKPSEEVDVRTMFHIDLTAQITKIDNYTLVNNDRVLVVAQEIEPIDTSSSNGIYSYDSSTKKLAKLTPDSVTGETYGNETGALVTVENGNTGSGERWYCIDYNQGLWIKFDSQIDIRANNPLEVVGNTIKLKPKGITNAHLEDGAVTNNKISADAVASPIIIDRDGKLGIEDSGISNAKLAGSITGDKLSNDTIGASKLKIGAGLSIGIGDNADKLYIANSSITAAMLAAIGVEGNTYSNNWSAVGDLPVAQGDLTRTIPYHLKYLYSAIKFLRGTDTYAESNAQNIAGAYTLASGKNTTYFGKTLPGSTTFYPGDLFFEDQAND